MNITTQNRDECFNEILPTLPKKRKEMYLRIKIHQPCTPQEIRDIYDMRINEVHPRFTELSEQGLIKTNNSKVNRESNKKNTAYVITSIRERIEYSKILGQDLVNEKAKLENDHFKNKHIQSDYTSALQRKEIRKIDQKLKRIII